MARVRIFTTDPEALEGHAVRASSEIVRAERLDVAPPALIGVDDEWPPDWVGVMPDFTRITQRLREPRQAPARLVFGLQGPSLLYDPELAAGIENLRARGHAIDIIVYLGTYGGAR